MNILHTKILIRLIFKKSESLSRISILYDYSRDKWTHQSSGNTHEEDSKYDNSFHKKTWTKEISSVHAHTLLFKYAFFFKVFLSTWVEIDAHSFYRFFCLNQFAFCMADFICVFKDSFCNLIN
jgi:hypothetical protein